MFPDSLLSQIAWSTTLFSQPSAHVIVCLAAEIHPARLLNVHVIQSKMAGLFFAACPIASLGCLLPFLKAMCLLSRIYGDDHRGLSCRTCRSSTCSANIAAW